MAQVIGLMYMPFGRRGEDEHAVYSDSLVAGMKYSNPSATSSVGGFW
jgi:hypothetical protein